MKLLRVFPRKTNATPDDSDVRFSPPGLFDEADEVHVSVTWTWDIPQAEKLAEAWRTVTPNVRIGGPAYDDPGGDFTPGLYIKKGYVFTSRGCPNDCWFCLVPHREGIVRELEIREGYNVLDSNLLACSDVHIASVFDMLERQPEKPRFTGGLEAKLMKPWIADRLRILKPETAFFAYDTPDDWEPLVQAVRIMSDAGVSFVHRSYRCYVLMGWPTDTIDAAESRLKAVAGLGIMPMAMLYDHGKHRPNEELPTWTRFQRMWANPFIVGKTMTDLKNTKE